MESAEKHLPRSVDKHLTQSWPELEQMITWQKNRKGVTGVHLCKVISLHVKHYTVVWRVLRLSKNVYCNPMTIILKVSSKKHMW